MNQNKNKNYNYQVKSKNDVFELCTEITYELWKQKINQINIVCCHKRNGH